MDTQLMTGRHRPRPRRRKGPIILFLFLFVVSAAFVYVWWGTKQANTAHVTPAYMADPHPIMVDGQWSGKAALGDGDGLLIPLEVAQKLFGDGVRYEQDSDSIILTTASKVLHFKTGALDATLNRQPFELSFAAKKSADGELYLPLAPFEQLFGVRADIGPQSGIVTLHQPEELLQKAKIPDAAGAKSKQLRAGPGRSNPIVEDVTPGSELVLWGEENGWYKAQSPEGNIGYMAKSDLVIDGAEQIPAAPADEPFVAWKLTGQKINLTWEAVYTANPDTSKIGPLTGVNVVAPTWFELQDGSGQFRSLAGASYSAWASKNGMQVWGVFSNGFEPDRTHAALASYDVRAKMIQQMLAYAKTFRLQGINLDFENVETADKDNLIEFVRELTPLAHEQNLVVSIDVTPKSNSEMWSAYLDRSRLAGVIDYMMLMAYDEHWAASPVSGSVASLSWTESSIRTLLVEDHVPKDKLILGMPLYTREWTEKPNAKGGVDVTSKTLSMNSVQKLIADKKLTPQLSKDTGQHYVEFKENGATEKIWIEDAMSIQERAELVKKYDLAGAGTWRRGFESSDIWGVLDKTLQSHP